MSDDSRPLAGLPPADRRLLIDPPLELAVTEVRFSTAAETGLAPDIGLRLRDRLAESGLAFARIEPMNQNRITLNVQAGMPAAPNVETGTQGWILTSADGSYQTTVLPQSVVFQTSKYERWSVSLRPALESLFGAIGELVAPVVVNRIGLRYVDRFIDPDARTPAAWRGRLDEHFLGPICDERIGDLVKAAQQQVELTLGEAQGALLRYGPFVDASQQGSVSFLLDIDVFDAGPTRFEAVPIVDRVEVLNRTAASLFQAVLRPDYLRSLQRDQEATDADVGQEVSA
jgi:uncharacterized protein (TIGR04255 family)